MSERLSPNTTDCGCCRGEPRTQPPVGDGSKLQWRFKRELCQHCTAAGCEWNFAHCIRTDRVFTEAAEAYVRRLRAQPPLPNGGAVALDSAKRVQIVRLHEPSEPDDGWKAGALRLLDGRCLWCGHPIQNISVDETAGVTWACFEGCNP